MRRTGSGAVALFTACIAAAAAFAAEPGPRSITPAERRGVEIAADFLERGPLAFLEALSPGSPWSRLPREDALAEIEARTGPSRGAEWQLLTSVPSLAESTAMFAIGFPSGADDTLIVRLTAEGDSWRVTDLEITAEAVRPLGEDDPALAATVLPAPASEGRPLVLFAGLLAALLTAAAIVAAPRNVAATRILCAGALVLGAGALAARWADRSPSSAAGMRDEAPKPEDARALRSALGVRRALAHGGEMPSIARLEGPAFDAAVLWKAQSSLQKFDLASVREVLATFPPSSHIPLAEILRGRVGFLESKEVDAAIAYERAVNLGPGRDALWQEAGQALSILGFDERGTRFLDRLSKIGSRDASAHYVLAMIAAGERNNAEAEKALRRAWQLQPIERKELLDLGVLWEVIHGPGLAGAVRLHDAAEPVLTPSIAAFDPIAVPDSAVSLATGDYLWIEIGEQLLIVPGGSSIRPEGTTFTDARTLRLRREELVLAQLPATIRAAAEPGAFAQPLLRRRIEETAEALASRNHWADIEELTRGLRADSEQVPHGLLLERATALRRLQRLDESNELFVAVAAIQSKRRKTDAATLLQLGQILSTIGMYDASIRLLERAGAIRPIEGLDERIRQIQLDRELSTRYAVHETEHFQLRYPPDASRSEVTRIGHVLEAELRRISTRLGARRFAKVTVNLLRWEDFTRVYSDHLLGFYDGRITLPLIGVPDMIPEVVAILSHELAHAIIAQMTNDQAPRWFQEGLATRMEMRRYSRNALNMYDADRLLSIAMLDAVIARSPDPSMITAGYIEAHTLIRFLESEFGADAIHRMLAAFAEGATTDAAIESVSSASLVEFDLGFRKWGDEKTRVFMDPEPIRYDSKGSDLIRMDPNSSTRRRRP